MKTTKEQKTTRPSINSILPRRGKLLWFWLLTAGWLSLISSWPLLAVNMKSENYRIQWGNINLGSGQPSSTNYNLGLTLGQIAPGLYTGTGFKVRAGFQYIHSIIPFSFQISKLAIDLGTLTPQTPATDNQTLTVSAGGAGGYQVLAFEAHPLRSEAGVDISDTTCDNGSCDETTAGVWTQTTTYGFGFNISGDDIPSDFVDNTYFRQFADQEAGESAQIIMSNSGVVKQAQATVTFKANISATQAAGNYRTNIVYLAVPSY